MTEGARNGYRVSVTKLGVWALVALTACNRPEACPDAPESASITQIDVVSANEPDRVIEDGGPALFVTGFQGSSMVVFRVAYRGPDVPSCVRRSLEVRAGVATGRRLLAWDDGEATTRVGDAQVGGEVQVIEPPGGPLVVIVEAYGTRMERTIVPTGRPSIERVDVEPTSLRLGQPVSLNIVLDHASPAPYAVEIVASPAATLPPLAIPSGASEVPFEFVPDAPGHWILDLAIVEEFDFTPPTPFRVEFDVLDTNAMLSVDPPAISLQPGATVILPIYRSITGEAWTVEDARASISARADFPVEVSTSLLYVEAQPSFTMDETLSFVPPAPWTGMTALAVTAAAPDAPVAGELIVNEALIAPPAGVDVSCDGVATSTFEEQFVELVNVSARPLDLTGVTIEDEASAMPGAPLDVVLAPHESLVVFGGPVATGTEGHCALVDGARIGDAQVITRSLALPASGAIVVRDGARSVIAELRYDFAPQDESLQYGTDLMMPFGAAPGDLPHVQHGFVGTGPYSPGTSAYGQTWRR